jgi:hemerythrin-like metal-binding protein
MEFIEWSESMSVGVPLIDHDHKIIVYLINLFHHHISTEDDHKFLGTALNTLIDYTLFHFAREEQVMKVCKYPSSKDHKKQHEALVEQVTDIVQHFFKNKELKNKEPKNKELEKKEDAIQGELLLFLKNWLINHILKQDMMFRPYAENNPEVRKLTTSMQTNEYQPQILNNKQFIPTSINWKKATFLLISQSTNFLNIITAILRIANVHKVQQASHTDEALKILHDFTPDLIVYGWQADDHQALPFLKKLREIQDNSTTKIPLLLISSQEESSAKDTALSAGASHYINEPIGIQIFFDAILETLKS